MKIGILTHQYINNYGAFLQAWALRKAISELFPEDEVQIIDYVNVKHYIINAGGWFRFYKNRETLKEWFAKVQLLRKQEIKKWSFPKDVLMLDRSMN